MTDWDALNHAYGSASDVPGLIERWCEAQDDKQPLDELWSRLCHQGTVYSASFATVPLLLEVGAKLGSEKCRDAVILVGSILASKDVRGGRRLGSETFRDLAQLTESCLSHDIDDNEFVYLMQALAVARETPPWDLQLSRLVDEELEGQCDGCQRSLLFAIGSEGYFAAAEDYVRRPDVRRSPITPVEPGQLPAAHNWLEQVPLAYGRTEVAQKIRYVFGDTQCPACNARLNVALAIEALSRRGLND